MLVWGSRGIRYTVTGTTWQKLQKVALVGSFECCAPPPRWRDLELWPFDQKRNQVISVPRCTSDKRLAKIRQQILEISWRHQNLGCIRSCRDLDVLTPKSNQFIAVPRCTSDKSLAKIRQQILKISRKHKTTTWITDGRTDRRTTRKHIASAGTYRRRRLKKVAVAPCSETAWAKKLKKFSETCFWHTTMPVNLV